MAVVTQSPLVPKRPVATKTLARRLTVARLVWISIGVLWLAAAASQFHQWTPVGDIAILYAQVEAMPDTWPGVGLYSRFGWYHPGPAVFLQSWIPELLLGSAGLTLAMVTVHLVALALAWRIAYRQDPLAGALVLLGLVALMWGLGPWHMLTPWNPYAGTMAAALLLMATWSAAQRQNVGAALVLPLGSYLTQAHLGYLTLSSVMVLCAVVLAASKDPGIRALPYPRKGWLIGVGVSAVLWVPVVSQQLRGQPGNLSAILESMGSGGERVGLPHGLAALSQAYGLPPYWLDQSWELLLTSWAVPWLAFVPIAGFVVALRRKDRLALRGLAVVMGANVASLIAISGISGLPAQYLVAWVPTVAVTSVAIGLWALIRPARPARAIEAAAYAASIGICAALTLSWSTASQKHADAGRAVDVLSAALIRDVGSKPFTLGMAAPYSEFFDYFNVQSGVIAQAVSAGLDIAVAEDVDFAFGGLLQDDTTGRVTYSVEPIEGASGTIVEVWAPFNAQEKRQLAEYEAQLSSTPQGTPENWSIRLSMNQLKNGRSEVALVRR